MFHFDTLLVVKWLVVFFYATAEYWLLLITALIIRAIIKNEIKKWGDRLSKK